MEPDCWKRRGQTRAAMGHATGALSDLDKAIELFNGRDPDVIHERGMVYHKVGFARRSYPRYHRSEWAEVGRESFVQYST